MKMNRLSDWISDRKKLFWFAAAAVLVLAPVILMCLRSLQIGINCFKVHPFWSDEMVYWREVRNFLSTGISGGYTGADDMPPRFANFGTHSFLNTLVYALFGTLFGWHDNSIMICNLVFFCLCLFVFVWWCRPDTKRMILLTAAVIFYLPLYYYVPTSMTEVLGYGGILLYTAALLRYIQKKEEKWFCAALLGTAFLCFFKLPNMAFFIPLVILSFPGRMQRQFCLRTFVCVLAAGLIYVVNSAFTAPYPWFFSDVFAEESVGKMIKKVWGRFTDNIVHFMSIHYGTRQEQMQRCFYLLMLLIFLGLTMYEIMRVKRGKQGESKGGVLLPLSYFLMLLADFVLVNALYEVWDWRDYRMLAPVAWSGLLILLLHYPPRTFLAPSLAAFLIFCFEILWPNQVFINWERTLPVETPEIAEYIVYDREAQDGFDNTLAVESIDLRLYMRLAPGIGIQNIFTPESIHRSRYVLVSDIDFDAPGYRILAEGEFGRLYVRD